MYHKIITSLSHLYFENGSNFNLQSWDKRFPKDVEIHVFSESVTNPKGFSDRVIWHNLYKECPELVDFIRLYKNNPHYNGKKPDKNGNVKYNYKYDAVKFGHKIFPLFRSLNSNVDIKAYWIDADVYCTADISLLTLDRWMPNDKIVSYLGRYDKHSECGFMGFNLHQKTTLDFVHHYEKYFYNNNLDKLKETHDSHVFDEARKTFGNIGLFEDLNNQRTDDKSPFSSSVLEGYLTHAKGNDKDRWIMKAVKRDKNLQAKQKTTTFRSDIHRK